MHLDPNQQRLFVSWTVRRSLSCGRYPHGKIGTIGYRILALRDGETETIIQRIETRRATFGQERADELFKSSFNEKRRSYSWPNGKQLTPGPNVSSKHEASLKETKGSARAGRGLRHMPFDKETFSEIGRKFFVHGSISRAVSRANVPLFSRARLSMGISVQDYCLDEDNKSKHDAIVYNCRSANTWSNDLALTATYFHRGQLTYGILLGCTADVERRVLNRVSLAKEQGFHPLLLAGIFSEIERERLIEVVDTTIDRIEGAIFDLDSRGSVLDEPEAPPALLPEDDGLQHPDGERYERRTAWLNTTFLQNRLNIWKRQVLKMIEHVDELCAEPATDCGGSSPPLREAQCALGAVTDADRSFTRTSCLIKERLQSLVEELDEKIEDCNMRVEGMAMATQWAHGDTNMDIARAAGRDSSQMRSISLVTMVFLPGTFFATVFSMTFFDWGDGGASVSTHGLLIHH
ncbi:hypothetical protein J7T55_005647 [Diaporthe amygdali]|uniref:uncharacterized protein n=1 Tax=Phomopsis amygdali TaxID=1214568 RepID=UPI0022FDBF35|nr:uncharacterized protein J7T55_005647 [Diaporthe amygdali]KAJ0124309.1 hypothetical protein J7T55_005647 [Diaporthe amygdali]